MRFFGRDRELTYLDRALAGLRHHGQLFVLSGRRGSGKTALVQGWLASRRKRALVWTAQPEAEELDQATRFTQALQRTWKLTGGAVRPFALDAWRDAFRQLAAAAETKRRIVVIDGASELMAEGSLFSSALQQAWDQQLQHRPVLLILIAHHASRVHEHLRSYRRAPLYGRLTGFWQARPIAWLDFAMAFHRWPLQDQLLAYAVTGGWPAFVSRLEPDQPARETLARLLIADEYAHSARALLADIDLAARVDVLNVLRALAPGSANRLTLSAQTRLSRKALNAALVDLETVGLVDVQEEPFDRPAPPSQRRFYRLIDQQLRFFFRFLERSPQPHSAAEARRPLSLHRPGLRAHLADVVAHEIVLPWLLHGGDRGAWPERIERAGPLAQIDASHMLGVDHQKQRYLLCGVLLSERPVGGGRVTAWAKAVEVVVQATGPGCKGRGVVISWSGFTRRAQEQARQTGTWLLDLRAVDRALRKWVEEQFSGHRHRREPLSL